MKKNNRNSSFSSSTRPLTRSLSEALAPARQAIMAERATQAVRAGWDQIADTVRELGGDLADPSDWRVAAELTIGK